MEFLIRFTQSHETFRLPEIQALAELEQLLLTVVDYSLASPYCIVRLPSVEAARRLVRRSILAQSIHEVWGAGLTVPELHDAVRARSEAWWPRYRTASFRVLIESFYGKRAADARLALINSFAYLPFDGEILMRDPDETFTLFEEWHPTARVRNLPDPERYFFARYVGGTARDLAQTYDLKKRSYISTTSMDAELALVTANMALAAPGRLVYDPFVGTGSFPIACAHFGALAFGSDIDGRTIRGRGPGGLGTDKERCLASNFRQYGLSDRLGDSFTADLTNSPVCGRPLFDAIVCDPPYGVREGLHVLGCRDPQRTPWVIDAGIKSWRSPDYVPPKRPYGFRAILDDILVFAATTLVENGRLCFWMPTANEDEELQIPSHPSLELIAECPQVFNKWTRRLITYRRRKLSEIDAATLDAYEAIRRESTQTRANGATADDLNPFRVQYFKKAEP